MKFVFKTSGFFRRGSNNKSQATNDENVVLATSRGVGEAKAANVSERPSEGTVQLSSQNLRDSLRSIYDEAISSCAHKTPKLGILRLDYNYTPAVGDIGKWNRR